MKYFVNIKDFKLKDLSSIIFFFENCDYVEVFKEEIVNFNLSFNDTLDYCCGQISRKIKSGEIEFNFNNKFNKYREIKICTCKNKKQELENICERFFSCDEVWLDVTSLEIKFSSGDIENVVVPFNFIDSNDEGFSRCSSELTEVSSVKKCNNNVIVLIGDKSEYKAK